MTIRVLVVTTMLLLTVAPASAQLDQLFKGLGIGQQSGLSDAKIGSGLKEALKVGTENTVKLTGRTDGYFLWDAIGEMTFDDARKILGGGDTAATEYFRAKTTERLTIAFQPIVDRTMNEIGVTRQYKELVSRYQAIPFVKSEALDIDHYVVTKALDGLFYVLGEEERRIRTNPGARVNDLLKEVFAK